MIEDDQVDVALVARHLVDTEEARYRFTHCSSLAACEDINWAQIDIILLDLNLPDSSGLNTFKCLKAMTNDVCPIIVLTGNDNLQLSIEAMHHGAQDYLNKDHVDIFTLTRAIHYAKERHALLIQLRASKEREHYLATHDNLTGLANRVLFEQHCSQSIRYAKRYNNHIAVAFFDLDNFKHINDKHGHPVGDKFLCTLADRMLNVVRESDIIARFGGDEFILLLNDVHGRKNVADKIESIISALNFPVTMIDHTFVVTTSVGVALFPDHGDSADLLIKHADIAMYHSKKNGKDQITIYQDSMSVSGIYDLKKLDEGN
ncbi:MAG: GGDEF domain-containing response regulator [Gammaproteobacteria bacterium]|nr:GGDEF domain-containing response regulator [Gammaproteobacteria bacterium]